VYEGLGVSLDELDNSILHVSVIFSQSSGDAMAPSFGVVAEITARFRGHGRYYGQVYGLGSIMEERMGERPQFHRDTGVGAMDIMNGSIYFKSR
jgi:hypothetical protein